MLVFTIVNSLHAIGGRMHEYLDLMPLMTYIPLSLCTVLLKSLFLRHGSMSLPNFEWRPRHDDTFIYSLMDPLSSQSYAGQSNRPLLVKVEKDERASSKAPQDPTNEVPIICKCKKHQNLQTMGHVFLKLEN